MRYPQIIVLLVVFSFYLNGKNPPQSRSAQLMPLSMNGWTAATNDQIYTTGNLDDYLYDGAELFLTYGFTDCLSRTYTKLGEPEIIADIFDMGNSFNAYGVFHHTSKNINNKYGQESEITPGSIVFWKDRYFISIMLSRDEKHAREAMEEIAEQIDENITNEGLKPDILDLLPNGSLDKTSIRYFTHPRWINTYYYLADSNELNINSNTEVVQAKYNENDHQSILLIISYPDKEQALAIYNQYTRHHFPSSNILQVVASGTNFYKGAMLESNYVALVLESTQQKNIFELFEDLQKKIIKRNLLNK